MKKEDNQIKKEAENLNTNKNKMIKPILVVLFFILFTRTNAQTNTYPFPSSGYVGIGTTSPASLLDVNGTITISGTGQFKVNTTNWPSSVLGNAAGRHIIGGTNQPMLALWNEANVSANNESSLFLGARNAMGATYIGGAYLRGAIENSSDGAGYLSFLVTNSTSSFIERMRINSNGSVGIGTTNWPTSVLGRYAGRHIIGGTDQPVLTLWNEASVAANNESSIILGAKNALGASYIGGAYLKGAIENNSNGAGYLAFLVTNTGSSFIERMRINDSGYVGIGTSIPCEKLSVDGNINTNGFVKAKKIIVTPSGWCDYVFASNYKLRSLSSLESYIQQNKHLPDVPSAKEVEENGISVGDNQALLLKKIEELTLYVIDLKKEIAQQQKQIDQKVDKTKKYNK